MTATATITFEEFHQWLHRQRAQAPVLIDEENRTVQIFNYDLAHHVLTEFHDFSSDLDDLLPIPKEMEKFGEGNFLRMDPPDHKRLRGLVSKAFTPKVITGLEPRIAEVTSELLDGVDAEFDLVDSLAYPLPVIVIAELLGIPASDRPLFRRWADALLSQQNTEKIKLDDSLFEKTLPVVREMSDYLCAHIVRRRANPGDDLISLLTQAEADGERLTDDQIAGFSAVLLIAGHITTTALLGNSVMIMDENPGLWSELAADRSLIPQAVEEFLRVRSPFPRLGRRTREELELGGVTIPANYLMMPWLAAANRDPARFADPDRVDIHRPDNKHLAFGKGIHFCIGAPLARLEARVALNQLLDRYTELRVSGEPEVFSPYAMASAKHMRVRAA
ncbi:cytochrome P450 [Herbihabitans rhizosphaerae]|uniref:Cytochrome P450 n=1 Tax=Herbihabitans rhizosphaerae TaxID=1872711 RepID=A0A4Q7KKT5_9PSEU|nr:cytochrome P450 [Herbihabitans rhizosphaerae]RZS36500.1 cytochrome P450 [Herbihabitans rhizosphaerae]